MCTLKNMFKNRSGRIFVPTVLAIMAIMTWFMQGLWFRIMSINSEAILYFLASIFWLEVIITIILLFLAIFKIKGLKVICLWIVYLAVMVGIGTHYPLIPYWVVLLVVVLTMFHLAMYFIFKWLCGLYFNIKQHITY